MPAQLKFDIRNLEVVNEEEEPLAVDSNLWSTYRPIPFEDNAVRYYFNTPDMYLTSNFSRDEIIDIHPDGTLMEEKLFILEILALKIIQWLESAIP